MASANGRWVAFSSFAAHVPEDTGFATTDFYLRDRLTGQTRAVNVGADGAPASAGNGVGPEISDDGRYIAFSHPADRLVPGADNLKDVFVYDRVTDTRRRISSAG